MAKKLPPVAFDDLAAAFADYGTTVRGYVRYQLVQRNLKPYVSQGKLRVLDVGGGSGGDAAWLAGRGHHVTFIEPSLEQRRFAERRFNFMLSDDERERITMVGEVLEDLPADTEPFDLFMIHKVALYQAESRLLNMLKPAASCR
jgi:S-adenosylmethionine-dependent methyltransferase